MVELPSNRLFYSSGSTDLYLNPANAETVKGAKMPRWLTDSTLTHTGRAGALLVGGHEDQLFAQPVQFGAGLMCLLVDGVAGNRFNAERRELPAGWPELILGLLLLLGILSLPFLKLLLTSAREQIDRGDVLLCAVSLVLGSVSCCSRCKRGCRTTAPSRRCSTSSSPGWRRTWPPTCTASWQN